MTKRKHKRGNKHKKDRRTSKRLENEEDLFVRRQSSMSSLDSGSDSDSGSTSDSNRENTAPSNQASNQASNAKPAAKADTFWKYTLAIPGSTQFKCKFCPKKMISITRFKYVLMQLSIVCLFLINILSSLTGSTWLGVTKMSEGAWEVGSHARSTSRGKGSSKECCSETVCALVPAY
jgi:hypothetical protein